MKKNRLHQTSLEVTVGAFVLLILMALGYFTILLSPTLMKTTYAMTVDFEDVTGLLNGDKVYLQGVDVGRVKSLDVRDQRAVVELQLNRPIQLREGYRISVEPSSVLGGRYIAIREGPLTNAPLAAGTKIVGAPPIDVVAESGEAVRSIRNALEKGGIISNLQDTLADARGIAGDLRAGRGTLGKLLTDDSAYTRLLAVESNVVRLTQKIESGDGTLGRLISDASVFSNLQDVVSNLRETTDRLRRGEGTIGKLLNDDSVFFSLKESATNLQSITKRINGGKGMVGRLMSEDDTLYNNLLAASSNLNRVASNIAGGKGTIGKLATDDAIYTELRGMINDVRAAVDDLRETTPISSFSSIFMGAF